MDLTNELEKLEGLRQRGALTEEEFKQAKESLLRQAEPVSQKVGSALKGVTSDPNTWPVLIHLSQFCGYLVPLAGLVVPIVLWQLKKGDSPLIDRHGKAVANWVISSLIYYAVAGLLVLILIGWPLLFGLAVLGLVFPIIGGVRASKGELWEYPLSISFFTIDPPPAVAVLDEATDK